MTYFKKIYFYLFLSIFILAGIHFSINTGITHDELHDYKVWIANKNSILNFFLNKNLDTSYLTGANKFYGSGFHYISIFLEFFSVKLPQLNEYTDYGKIILSKHISVFLLFVASGLIFKKIIKLITKNNHHANLSTIFYLLYPYLLGHSFFNIKDIPFLTFWLICTYFFIRIIKNLLAKKIIYKKDIILLSFFTAYLLSIRISGILIFVQYIIFILVLSSEKDYGLFYFIKKNFREILFSFFTILSFYIILQPSYWSDPLLIVEAIKYMSQHIQTVCTITLGECMKAQNLPASYLPIWFFFKLPIIILVGLVLFFKIEEKINLNPFILIVLKSLAFSILAIIFLLIIFNVNLYDEIRQVMFLIPLILIVSLSFIYFFSKKFFNFSIIFFIIFFIIQNINIYPYNYIWINNFSHLTKVQNVFELDYWGASTKRISNFLMNNNDKEACLITNRNQAIDTFITKKKCLINFSKLHESNKRPFYVALMERGINKGTPNNCDLVYEEKIKINFSKEEISLAKIYKCI